MAKKINTSKSLTEAKVLTDAELKKQIKGTNEIFQKEKLVPFSVPPSLQKHIGETMFISINGSKVVIPVDGKSYEIPESLAKLGQQTINKLTT